LKTRDVTSMQRLLGRTVPLEDVVAALVPEFAAVFGREMIEQNAAAAAPPRRTAAQEVA